MQRDYIDVLYAAGRIFQKPLEKRIVEPFAKYL